MGNDLQAIGSYLKARSILTIATINGEGKPELDTVDYMWTGKSLFFFTDARSRKARNIMNNSYVTVMVADQDADFFQATSVEVFGHAKFSEDPSEIGAYMQNFMSRRPQFASLPPNAEMQENMRVYEITPLKFRMLDNRIAPGHFDEFQA